MEIRDKMNKHRIVENVIRETEKLEKERTLFQVEIILLNERIKINKKFIESVKSIKGKII